MTIRVPQWETYRSATRLGTARSTSSSVTCRLFAAFFIIAFQYFSADVLILLVDCRA